MRVWRLLHGLYEVLIGVDHDGDDQIDQTLSERKEELARYGAVEFAAPPRQTVVLELRLLEALERITARPDLAVGPGDVTSEDGSVKVTVHNIGAAAAPATTVEFRDAGGQALARADVPSLQAPLDLEPKTVEVRLELARALAGGCEVVVDPAGRVREITKVNNVASVGG
jgi:hypothetical protein